ncbi:hypothetical protein [Lactiplantibacillus carotarum]|uniref:hypothetical protein n=1 Tax=Lactiplantibacillus carotarum TaxID=2993456 RepID=UPI00298F0394|nr:hypothetical protein [Lactiplantibacillus carotarum]
MLKQRTLILSIAGVVLVGGALYAVNRPGRRAAATASQKVLTVYAAGPKPLSDHIVKGFEKRPGLK